MRRLTFSEIMEYETFSTNLIQSILYGLSERYFVWVCKRKYNRYCEAMKFLNK